MLKPQKKYRNLLLIPIKIDSERYYSKCTSILKGKPLYLWTIEYTLINKSPDDIVVILCMDAQIEHEGCISRPQKHKHMYDDFIDICKEYDFENIVLLQVTSPYRESTMFDRLTEELNGNDSV